MRLDQDIVRAIILDIESNWPARHNSLLITNDYRREYLPSVELDNNELAEYMVCLLEAGPFRFRF